MGQIAKGEQLAGDGMFYLILCLQGARLLSNKIQFQLSFTNGILANFRIE